MGTVLISKVCHYCTGRATTEDHIVPRAALPPMSTLPYWFRSQDVVPACLTCNGAKADLRSDCDCGQCRWAWGTARARFLATGYVEKGFIALQQDPTLRRETTEVSVIQRHP